MSAGGFLFACFTKTENKRFFVPSQFDFDNLTLETEKEPSIIMRRNRKNN